MRVVVPHTSLHPATVRSVTELAPEAEWWDVSGSIFAYSQLMARLWAEQEDVLIVEHDIELTEEALRTAIECPCEWSVNPYGGPHEDSLLRISLGCTRFRASLMKTLPDVVTEANQINDAGTVCPPGDWKRLDCRLYSVLRGCGEDIRSPHEHPEVWHHHSYPGRGCACGRTHEEGTDG